MKCCLKVLYMNTGRIIPLFIKNNSWRRLSTALAIENKQFVLSHCLARIDEYPPRRKYYETH